MNLKHKIEYPARTTQAPDFGIQAAANSAPVSANAARQAVEPFRQKRNAHAVFLLTSDYVAFAAGQYLAVAASSIWLKVLGMIITWVSIVRLFLIGHDACHQAFVSNQRGNEWMARIAFLVSLTPYSTWRAGHNLVHHGFNNLRGRDFVWEPKTPAEYAALPAWRQRVERLYRSVAGPPLYYLIEIWWRCLFFPGRRQARPRTEFKVDSLLVACVAGLWIALIYRYTATHGTAFWPTLLLAFVIPFLLWNWSVGLVVYLHHTSPDVRWYADKRQWKHEAAQLASTIHLVMPWPLGPLIHHIMEHPAHHLDATIPLYHLKKAQQHLKNIGAGFVSIPFTLGYYWRCVNVCQLYDYQHQRWVPFPQ